MNNGGFDQFFVNKGIKLVREAELAANEMKLEPVARLIGDAIKAVSEVGSPRDHKSVLKLLADEGPRSERVRSALSRLDDKFFDLDPYPPFIEARLRYALAHAGEFFET